MLEETRLDYALVTVFVDVWIYMAHVADWSWMTLVLYRMRAFRKNCAGARSSARVR
jgi:hypothetical protein